MPTKKLTFENANGESLSAVLELPDVEPVAYGLFAHCFTCSKNFKAVRNISRAMCGRGIAVMGFDFTGLGESEGEFADTNFSSNVDDLVMAAEFLGSEYSAPEILIGHSLGGAAVIQAAHRIPAARVIATIGSPVDPEYIVHHFEDDLETIERTGEAHITLAGRTFRIKKQFIDDLERTKMDIAIRGLGRPLMIFHSPVDATVGIDNASRIFKAARHPKSFVSLDKADHLLSDPADSAFVGAVIADWAGRYVGPKRA